MKKLIALIILVGIIGLVVGYLIFGTVAGEYVSIKTIFSSSGNAISSFGRKVTGITQMKQNILISGGVGGILGIVLYYFKKK